MLKKILILPSENIIATPSPDSQFAASLADAPSTPPSFAHHVTFKLPTTPQKRSTPPDFENPAQKRKVSSFILTMQHLIVILIFNTLESGRTKLWSLHWDWCLGIWSYNSTRAWGWGQRDDDRKLNFAKFCTILPSNYECIWLVWILCPDYLSQGLALRHRYDQIQMSMDVHGKFRVEPKMRIYKQTNIYR